MMKREGKKKRKEKKRIVLKSFDNITITNPTNQGASNELS